MHSSVPSFSSLEYFDGAGGDSFGNHGSFNPEAQRDVLARSRRDIAEQSGSVSRQGHGMHDFSQQVSQQPQSGSANWDWNVNNGNNEQQRMVYSGMYGADESGARGFHMRADTYGAMSHSANPGMEVVRSDIGGSSGRYMAEAAGSPVVRSQPRNQLSNVQGSGGLGTNLSMARTEVGGSSGRFIGEVPGSSVVRTESRNQPFNVQGSSGHVQSNQGSSGHLQINQFKFSHPMSMGTNMFLHHPNLNNAGGFDNQSQSQNSRFHIQNMTGVPYNDTSYEIQLPWNGPGPGTFGQPLGGPQRPVGPNDLQLLQQQSMQSHQLHGLQRQLLAQQLKQQLEHYKQQQLHQEFPGTSYSALLHGPDTPPSQPEPTGGLPGGELETETAPLLSSNTSSASFTGPGWPLNGVSYYHGFPTNGAMGQDPNLALQLISSKGLQVDHSPYAGNRDGALPAASFHQEKQNVEPEQYNGGPNVPLDQHMGKSMLQTPYPGISQFQMDGFASVPGSSHDVAAKEHIYHSSPLVGQNSHHYGEELSGRSQMTNSPQYMNPLPKSQQSLGNVQQGQQRNWAFNEQRRVAPVPAPEAMKSLPQNVSNFEESHGYHSLQQSSNNIDNRMGKAGYGQVFQQQVSYEAGSSLLENVGAYKQQQNWSTGTPLEQPTEQSAQQGFAMLRTLQAQQTRSDLSENLFRDAKRKVQVTSASQQGSHSLSNPHHPVDTSSNKQMGFTNAQNLQRTSSSDIRESAPTWMANSSQPNPKSINVLLEMRARRESGWKESDRATKMGHAQPPSLEARGHSQGSWKSHTPLSQSPAGTDTVGQSSDKDGHGSICNYDFQHGNVDSEVSYRRQVASRTSNTASTGEEVFERPFMGGEARQQMQIQNTQTYVENHHTLNFTKALGEQPVKLASDVNNFAEISHHQRVVDSEAPCAKKQKKHPEQTDGNASSMSLAHLRCNQGPLSPQNIRLGLGPPSHTSQNVQQVHKVSWYNSSHSQGPDAKLPNSSAVGMDQIATDYNFQPQVYGGSGTEVRGDRADLSQRSDAAPAVYMNAQSPASFSMPSNISEGHVSATPVHATPFEASEGLGSSGRESKFPYSKPPMAMPPYAGAQLRGSRLSSSYIVQEQPAYNVQQQSAQQQPEMSFPLSQGSQRLAHSDALTSAAAGGRPIDQEKRFANTKTQLGTVASGNIMMKVSMGHQTTIAATGHNRPLLELQTMQHAGTSSGQAVDNQQQASNSLLSGNALQEKQTLDAAPGASTVATVAGIGKGQDSTHMVSQGANTNIPYPGVGSSEQMSSQISIPHGLSASGRVPPVPQHFLGNNVARFVSYGGQICRPPVVVEKPILREGESRYVGRDGNPMLDQISQHHFTPPKRTFHGPVSVHPKKRKKPLPLLIPWHVAASQPRGQLPSTSEAELNWANATNRIREKDDGENRDESISSVSRAKRRLRLTTQLMQQLIPPLPSALMHGNTIVDNECATYSVAKLALGEACRMVAGTEKEAGPALDSTESKNMVAPQTRTGPWGMAKQAAMSKFVEKFAENIKRLDSELGRLDCSLSASELKAETQELEKLSIVNRLAKHHGTGFSLDPSEDLFVENISDLGPGIRRPPPQKYVTAVPIPRTLPEGVRCLPL